MSNSSFCLACCAVRLLHNGCHGMPWLHQICGMLGHCCPCFFELLLEFCSPLGPGSPKVIFCETFWLCPKVRWKGSARALVWGLLGRDLSWRTFEAIMEMPIKLTPIVRVNWTTLQSPVHVFPFSSSFFRKCVSQHAHWRVVCSLIMRAYLVAMTTIIFTKSWSPFVFFFGTQKGNEGSIAKPETAATSTDFLQEVWMQLCHDVRRSSPNNRSYS